VTEDADGDGTVLLTLPESLRSAFKDPFGPVETDPDALLAGAGTPVVAVGDMVTYHLRKAGRPPAVAIVDEKTKREAVGDEVREAVVTPDVTVPNPAGAIGRELVVALGDALAAAVAAEAADGDRSEAEASTTILVDGEEDLGVLPAVMLAPEGATVVYGQPDEGMVAVPVTAETKAEFRALLDRMDGDHERFWALVREHEIDAA
jgi:uncharacterized protein (UPF0218 family)